MTETVSIICVTYNEEKLIARTIESFIRQETNGMQIEILIIDGFSEDGTRDIVNSYTKKFPNIRLIDNPDRKNPYGRNIGLCEAKGNYIALLGAHTIYESNYIRICIDEIKKTNSIGVSGKVITSFESDGSEAQLCELILTSPFGVSGKSFRTIEEGYTSMVNFPVYRRRVIDEIGFYDTALLRNQDNDFNRRIIEKGFKLYCTWKTSCKYFPSDSLKQIFSYANRNGYWNAKSLSVAPKSMMMHHFIPLLFVTAVLLFAADSVVGFFLGSVIPLIIFLLIIFTHLLTGFFFALKIKKFKSARNIFALPFLFFAFHFSYGFGTLKGLFTPMPKKI
ncbi:MAG: glycosyltransferase family 2 protein [Bacteroidetes bacterium]|nr:glycosyltransferase family 2 protein [Bacteroidota bacterium]